MISFIRILFFLTISLGCQDKVSLFRVTTVQLSSPQTKISYQNVESFPLSGSCHEVSEVKMIVSSTEFNFPCVNSKWHALLDFSFLPEGHNKFEIYGKGNNAQWIKFKEYSFLKDTKRPNQISSFVTSKITSISNSTSIKMTNGTHLVMYASDEYCMNPKCGVMNLIIRSSVDNYQTAHFITKNNSIDSSFPSLIEKGGKLHLSYLSNERNRNILDVIYSQVDVTNFSVLNRVNLTPHLTRSAINPFLRQTQSGEIHLTYLSDEYCTANSCSQNKITHRSDADGFSTKNFYGTHLDCNISDHRFYTNPLNNKLHLAYGLDIAGACTGPNTGYTQISEDGGTLTHQRLALPHRFSSVALVVDSQDKASIFFATSNNSVGCTGWKLAMKTSQDNWVSQVNLPNTCLYGGSYAGISHSPSATSDEFDVIHLFYGTQGRVDTQGFALSYKTSTDGYIATTNLSEDYFSSVRNISVTKDPEHFKVTFQGDGSHSGGLKLVSTLAGSITQKISPTFKARPVIHFNDDKLYVISYSDDFCKSSGLCSRNNFVLEEIVSGQKTFLTKLIDPKIFLTNPRLIRKSDEILLFYESSETLNTHQSIVYRSSLDNFSAVNELTNVPTTIGSIVVDESNELKMTYATTTGAKKTSFKESLSAVPVVLPPLESFYSILTYHPPTNRSAIIYNGNESGWLTSLRTSDDDFSSYTRINGATTNAGYNAYFTPSGVLHTLSVFDPSVSGKNGLVVRSEIDGFIASPFLFDTSIEGSVCVTTPHTQYDKTGTLHVTYSLKKEGEKFCNIWYRNSLNWGRSQQITFSQSSDNAPSNLFIQSNNKAIICGGSSFNLDCFKL